MLYNILKKLNFDGTLEIKDSNNKVHSFGNSNPKVTIKLVNKSIERILKNKKNIAKSGFKYASQFDNYYFKNMWSNILFQLINEKQSSR